MRDITVEQFRVRFAAAGKRAAAGAPESRCGAEWERFLGSWGIRAIRDDGPQTWAVESAGGRTYTVGLHVEYDDMGLESMSLHCTCPARRADLGGRVVCRHRCAVADMLFDEAVNGEDWDAADWLERVV
jgi:hypothetical protein